LKESVDTVKLPQRPFASEGDQAALSLWNLLALEHTLEGLRRRIRDMQKNIDSARNELKSLQGGVNVIAENRMFGCQEEIQSNTKNLEDVFRSNERASTSLDVLQVILAGTLAFEILDRLTGEWSVIDQPWAQFLIVQPFMHRPGVWFVVNILLWVLIGLGLLWLKVRFTERSNNVLCIRLKMNHRINLPAMTRFLATKPIAEESVDIAANTAIRKVHWEEVDPAPWQGSLPLIEVQFDRQYGFLLCVTFTVSKPCRSSEVNEERLRETFFGQLESFGALEHTPSHAEHTYALVTQSTRRKSHLHLDNALRLTFSGSKVGQV